MNKFKFLYTIFIGFLILAITSVIYIFAKGYSISLADQEISKTGWILVKSIPDGATVYRDGKLEGPTNASISKLNPKSYKITVKLDGFNDWEKIVPVEEEKVTLVEAFLIKNAANLTPLTTIGVVKPFVNKDQTLIVYYAKTDKKSGLWSLPIGGSFINWWSPKLIASSDDYENISNIEFSPLNDQILVTKTTNDINTYELLEVNELNLEPGVVTDPDSIRKAFLAKQNQLDEELVGSIADAQLSALIESKVDYQSSPDKKKVLYKKYYDDRIEYFVLDLTKPLPFTQAKDRLVYIDKSKSNKVMWHATSSHIIIYDSESISIIQDDGSNKNTIFNGSSVNDFIASPQGSNDVFILTSFSKNSPSNIYKISFN